MGLRHVLLLCVQRGVGAQLIGPLSTTFVGPAAAPAPLYGTPSTMSTSFEVTVEKLVAVTTSESSGDHSGVIVHGSDKEYALG